MNTTKEYYKSANNTEIYSAINAVKCLLLIGVVAIHCNTIIFANTATESTIEIYNLIRYPLTYCVPLFFIISGFLFFRNIESFNAAIYRNKMKSRIITLLIPYLLWNTAAGIIRFLKAKYLGFEGDGIYVNGEFSLIGFLSGYWDTGTIYPMLFNLWFIRNLIIFQILAPIFYFIGRNKYFTLSILIIAICNIDLYGGEYFLFGSFLGIHKYNFTTNSRHSLVLFIAFTVVSFVLTHIPIPIFTFQPILHCICSLFIIPVTLLLLKKSPKMANLVNICSPAFFFIYAIHGMYSTVIVEFCISIVPINNILGLLASSFASLIINILLSTIFFITLKKLCPNLLQILTGSRFSLSKPL